MDGLNRKHCRTTPSLPFSALSGRNRVCGKWKAPELFKRRTLSGRKQAPAWKLFEFEPDQKQNVYILLFAECLILITEKKVPTSETNQEEQKKKASSNQAKGRLRRRGLSWSWLQQKCSKAMHTSMLCRIRCPDDTIICFTWARYRNCLNKFHIISQRTTVTS